MPVPRWLPNAISVLRIVLVPAWVAAAEVCRHAAATGASTAGSRSVATALLLLIGASDLVDGWLARRFGLATRAGATLDAVADKLCQLVLVTWLTVRAPADGIDAFVPLPWWFMAILLARDAVLLSGFLLVRARAGAVRVEHRYHGKGSSALLFLLLLAVIAGQPGPWITPALLLTAALVAASTIAYARDGWRELRRGASGSAAP